MSLRCLKLVNQRFLSKLALIASIFALGVIALGAFTRLLDAGLGCPDWPGCYGHIIVPSSVSGITAQYPGTQLVSHKAWAEMIHRYFVGGLSLFILAIVGIIFAKKALRTIGNICFALGLLLLLAYQIMLGQWTVTLKLLPTIVTQHLLGGFFILSTLWMIHLNNKISQNHGYNQPLKKLIPFALVGLILLVAQILLGAWTSTNYASLSCADIPFCMNDNPWLTMHFKEAFNLLSPVGVNYEGGVLPTEVRQTIQMVHRCGALVVTLYIFGFMLVSIKLMEKIPELLHAIYLVFGLISIQICIGIVNVLYKLPLASAMMHNIVAALILLSFITFIFKLISYSREVVVS